MGVTIQAGLLEFRHLAEGQKGDPHEKLPFGSIEDVLRNMHQGFYPLMQTDNTNDNLLGRRGLDALRYLAQALEMKQPYQDITPITNWDLLRTLAYAPADTPLFIGQPNTLARTYQEWGILEDVGVRALNRVGAIRTHLFQGQQTYSIFGLDLERIRMTMQEALAEGSRLPREQRHYLARK